MSKFNNADYLPIAVYGTLRQGFHNHMLMEGLVLDSVVRIPKFKLAVMRGEDVEGYNSVPFAYRSTSMKDSIEVELYLADSNRNLGHAWTSTLTRLDHLEGHPDWYKRVPVSIAGNGQPEG